MSAPGDSGLDEGLRGMRFDEKAGAVLSVGKKTTNDPWSAFASKDVILCDARLAWWQIDDDRGRRDGQVLRDP